jgi:glucose/arabinose dehydrogenase
MRDRLILMRPTVPHLHPQRITTISLVCLAMLWGPLAPDALAQLSVRPYASGFSAPIAFVQDPTDRDVQFVVEQGGRIRTVRNGIVQPADFLNLSSVISSGGERGLLGLAFAPNTASGRFFVNFTDPAGNTVVARFRRSVNPLVADASSRFDLRWGGPAGAAFIAQPFANHNGGNLVFGADGYLYIGLGDGGSGDDPENHAQTPGDLLGKMLRIDVSVADSDAIGYRIPSNNPFAAGPAGTRPEIWSFGLRNPWRYTFDDPARGGTGALIIGDVGQNRFEEVDYEPAGAGGRNYGWRIREGVHDNVTLLPPATPILTEPIHEYTHDIGASITGGYVYRGRALGNAYRGRYFFADFVSGRLWSIPLAISGSGEATAGDRIDHTPEFGGVGNISSFGTDSDGELYVVSYSSGTVFKLFGPPNATARPSHDFDGDGRSDVAIYRPSTGTWWVLYSSQNYTTFAGFQWGLAGDVPLVGDFDGDARQDFTIYRPTTGTWWVLYSSQNYRAFAGFQWGLSGDVPLVGDFDGDGRLDFTIYRPATGQWWVLYSSQNYTTYAAFQWGLGGDVPFLRDFDGDGRPDFTIYRPATSEWWVLYSSRNYTTFANFQWGASGDVPLVGDFDGDGQPDVTTYRPTTGEWRVLYSSRNYTTQAVVQWGLAGDVPVIRDLDGDGVDEITVYRPTTGEWYALLSSRLYDRNAFGVFQWGLTGDLPLP